MHCNLVILDIQPSLLLISYFAISRKIESIWLVPVKLYRLKLKDVEQLQGVLFYDIEYHQIFKKS